MVCAVVALRHEQLDALADHLDARVAEQALGLGVDEDDAAVVANDHDGIGGGFKERVHGAVDDRSDVIEQFAYAQIW